jgi:hypothetical protein
MCGMQGGVGSICASCCCIYLLYSLSMTLQLAAGRRRIAVTAVNLLRTHMLCCVLLSALFLVALQMMQQLLAEEDAVHVLL